MKTKINFPHMFYMLKPTCTCINHQIKWKHSTCFPQVQHWSIFRHRLSCYWQFCTSCPPHSSRPARIIFFGTAGHICNETWWGSYSLVNMMASKIWQYQTNIIIIGDVSIQLHTILDYSINLLLRLGLSNPSLNHKSRQLNGNKILILN